MQANEEGGFCSLENDETCWKNDGVTCMGAEVTERLRVKRKLRLQTGG